MQPQQPAELAIADDLGAVAVIAIFYTANVSLPSLLLAGALLALLFLVLRMGDRWRGFSYLLIVGVWLAVFDSGIHSTVAGILLAMVVPIRPRVDPRLFIDETEERLGRLRTMEISGRSVLANPDHLNALESIHSRASAALPPGLVLERSLHPVQAWLILPLFALANAGVALGGDVMAVLRHPLSLGIIAGLVMGKPLASSS